MERSDSGPPYSFVAAREGYTRRSFLVTTSLAAASLWASRLTGLAASNPTFSNYPFQLGVASGDPSPDGFVLWTRLAPSPLEDDGGMPPEPVLVSWQVAEDEKMTKVVQRGEVAANPDWAHSVHVEVEGLKPDRWYWYQFRVGNEVSPLGRTRTMPAEGSDPAKLRFAFASCQRYGDGYYTAYEHMAAEDIDLVVHLGDYIYEKGCKPDAVRKFSGGTTYTLEDYRKRLALHKTDPALQRMHALVPWIVTWDDHETWNNFAGAAQRSESQLKRRAAAYKAYYEHMPLRRISLPVGPDMQLYRRLAFGQLADFLFSIPVSIEPNSLRPRISTPGRGVLQSQGYPARHRAARMALRRTTLVTGEMERSGPTNHGGTGGSRQSPHRRRTRLQYGQMGRIRNRTSPAPEIPARRKNPQSRRDHRRCAQQLGQ